MRGSNRATLPDCKGKCFVTSVSFWKTNDEHSTTMRTRVVAFAGLTVSAHSYAPAARRSFPKSQVQHVDSDSDRVHPLRRRQVQLHLESASADSPGARLPGTGNESQASAFIPSEGFLPGNNHTEPGARNATTLLQSENRLSKNEPPARIGSRTHTLASPRFRDALPKRGGDELDRLVLSTAIPSVCSSTLRCATCLR
jgi:hypothetical protein